MRLCRYRRESLESFTENDTSPLGQLMDAPKLLRKDEAQLEGAPGYPVGRGELSRAIDMIVDGAVASFGNSIPFRGPHRPRSMPRSTSARSVRKNGASAKGPSRSTPSATMWLFALKWKTFVCMVRVKEAVRVEIGKRAKWRRNPRWLMQMFGTVGSAPAVSQPPRMQ